MKAINKSALAKLNNPETNVLLLLVDRLGTRCERIDYGSLAEELGITRNAFKYHIDKLKRARIVIVAGDKMKLSDGIIIEINEEEQREESG